MSRSTPPPPLSVSEDPQQPVPPQCTNKESSQTKSSLDITQKLERNLARLNSSNNVYKRWAYEIISWSVSALCMAAMVGILVFCNNKTLTKSSLYLTAISVLSKLASAALILPTSEALGQLKWDWFNGKKSKEIWDFEIFDKASRGPWGSIMLLLRTKGRSLAALGAILTVLLLANDTFFQQVVNLPERWILKGQGSIAKLVRYDPLLSVETRQGYELAQQDLYVRPVLEQFFYENGTQPVAMGSGSRPEVPVSCPTSNCTFPEFDTLGVCSQCTDISDLLQFGCRSARMDWIGNLTAGATEIDQMSYPNGTACGYFLNFTSDSATLVSGYTTTDVDSPVGSAQSGEALLLRLLPLTTVTTKEQLWGGSLRYKNLRSPILDTLIVSAKNGAAGVYRNETPLAQECVLSWCVKHIRSSYSYALLEEEITSTTSNSTPGANPWYSHTIDINMGTTIGFTEDINIHLPGDNWTAETTYGMSNTTHTRMRNIFDDIFPSYLTATNETAKPSWKVKNYLRIISKRLLVRPNPWVSPNNITTYMERMATAMTNTLRSSSSNQIVEGSAYAVETYVSVQWAWLTFPFLLLILSLVFLVATMRKTATGPGVWKTSAMPALIYSLPKDMQKDLTPPAVRKTGTSSSASSEGKKNIRIRLHPEKGWRVSGQPVSPSSPVVVLRSNQPPPGWIES